MRKIIVSVGTSILTNGARNENCKWFGRSNGNSLPSPEDIHHYLENVSSTEASAETNTLEKLILEKDDILYWLHSDTPEGELCANQLNVFYKKNGTKGECKRIESIGYEENTFQELGFRSLVNKSFEIINGEYPAIICATGGFKAEIAYLNLVGLLTKTPVFYIHEKFKNLIEFPTLPIEWDYEIVDLNLDFFNWIDEEPRSKYDVENRLKSLPDMNSLVFYDDECGYLTAAGTALFKSYKLKQKLPSVSWLEKDPKPADKKIRIESTSHHRPERTDDFINWLSNIEWVSLIRYSGGANQPVSSVKSDNSETGEITVSFSDNNFSIKLIIMTTAKNSEQTDLAVEYIKKYMKSFK